MNGSEKGAEGRPETDCLRITSKFQVESQVKESFRSSLEGRGAWTHFSHRTRPVRVVRVMCINSAASYRS